jgi:Flp pilus assembly protein TadG
MNGKAGGEAEMMIRNAKHKRMKWAAATVEFAIISPLLLTLVFGVIEYGWVFTVRQALSNAAREGARTAVLRGVTDTEIEDRVNYYLAAFGLTGQTINIQHSTSSDPTETVTVSIPYADVTLLGSFFGNTDFDLSFSCSMRKEGAG